MDEDSIEYYFNSIKDFYADNKELLIETNITKYIRFLKRYSNEYVSNNQELSQAAYRLIDSTLFLENSTLILSHLINLALSTTLDDTHLWIVYGLLYYIGKEDPRWMNFIVIKASSSSSSHCYMHNPLLSKLLSEMQSFKGGYQCMSLTLQFLYEMYKVTKASQIDLESTLSFQSINFLFQLVESTTEDSQEAFNYQFINVLLVLNEQYMMNTDVENKVLNVLSTRLRTSPIFAQNLIFMLNRSSEDECTQVLILKLLYGIFTRSDLFDFFYINDLHVLIDIILRELDSLDDNKTRLCNSYLRVLEPLLTNTPLKQQKSFYKKHEIHQVLCSLITPYLHRTVKTSTRKLVKEILEKWWETICNKPVAPLLGIHVKHAIIESGINQQQRNHNNAVIMSEPPSDSEDLKMG
ncbi:uncharacterized protein BX663DRAFT_556489 [Cokeromyces recurvatus]|uniref:uncharacterized protein n=1 Tax=Cokeromyces recurvatus TaxID=90255 RepID=UPI00222059C7|nr:uncharacterized protein BX663DRAFT_556489 [Cokeromyces recurvatus]KAI7897746.1 hypothetical protein BX663DRAFT_556489 [Cokeromyces recurvatus]